MAQVPGVLLLLICIFFVINQIEPGMEYLTAACVLSCLHSKEQRLEEQGLHYYFPSFLNYVMLGLQTRHL